MNNRPRTIVFSSIEFMRIFAGFLLQGASNDCRVIKNVNFSAFGHYIVETLGNKIDFITY